METKRKTDLFRFVTLRSPELISESKRQVGFLEHPTGTTGEFMTAISGEETLAEQRTAAQGVLAIFSPYTTVAEIKALSEETWDFAIWLSQNKNKLVRTELDALIPETLPDSSDILELWDNVFYDILTQANASIRQGCLQMLVAINFATNYETYSPGVTVIEEEIAEEARLLKRLANAKVIVHEAFSVSKTIPEPSSYGLESMNYSKQEAFHKAKVEGLKLTELEFYKSDLIALGKLYNTDYQTAYDTAFATYKTNLTTTIDNFMRQRPKFTSDSNLEESLPDELAAPFEFSYDKPLSPEYTAEKLSDTTILYINQNNLEDFNVQEAIEYLELEIAKVNSALGQSLQKRHKEVLINGVPVRAKTDAPKTFTFSFKLIKGSPNYYAGYLSINVGYNGAFLRNADFSIYMDSTTYESEPPTVISNNENSLFIELRFETLYPLPQNTEFTLTGSFDLNNGKSFVISKGGISGTIMTSGVATLALSEDEPILYGVNKIGVADFRRVEQELCCYVAGEVSHIENIMAKEYKEKSTRNFISSETSVESITETETEELSDTVSTTRHELSSEISKIIDRDRNSNLGFTTSAQGKILKNVVSASAYGDFSFGQSTSDSSTIAKNYAEDLTRRALERIVHKVSQRRTSKIRQEFEDNVKHGFDNREGENHVTGVYRWIDKVYKNRIVNYGRRLIYEFMLPEPARFYKEAIIIKAEEESSSPVNTIAPGNSQVAVKPLHPSELDIKSYSDINRENYGSLAAQFGINTPLPPQDIISVTDVYTAAPGNTDKAQSFPFIEKKLPVAMDYVCTAITAKISYSFKANVASGYIKVSTGGLLWQKIIPGGSGQASVTVNPNPSYTNLNIPDSVPVSVNTKQITSFIINVTATCKLKSSVYNQWQQDVYADMLSAYQSQLQVFNDSQAMTEANAAIAEGNAPKDSTLQGNPLYNQEIVKTEIKRICIELLTKPFDIPQGKDFYENGSCDIPQIKQTGDLDLYGSRVKFFEQAFDWDIMAHVFYPYYWAKKCDWKSLFQSQDANDYIFQMFLQSGFGRVLVPVREGFEDAVTFYMETGQVWNGLGLVIDTDDELYVSVADEMAVVDGSEEPDEWETVVPSSLTLLQARSVLLDEEGLPCCETDEEVLEGLNLLADTTILTREGDTPEV